MTKTLRFILLASVVVGTACGDSHGIPFVPTPDMPVDPELDYVQLGEAEAEDLCTWWHSLHYEEGRPSTDCSDADARISVRPIELCMADRLTFRELDCVIPVQTFYDCAPFATQCLEVADECRFEDGCMRNEGMTINYLTP